MQVSEIIAKKRDGKELCLEELDTLITGYLSGEIKDYQMSAWLMAVYFKGMTENELSNWTRLMWKSGQSFPRRNKTEFWIDKHSTGGVGDKPSLILVPLVHRLCEKLIGPGLVKIPMISGRGLGHSGGTLDKLDSVPGFTSQIEMNEALDLISNNGFFMLGQTDKIAPADKMIYALRDVTATVESNPLIVSSIMSKKLAESPDGIVFDVKTGSGAFMTSVEKAELLASLLVSAAKKEKVDAVALITKMDEPLGWKVGNALEIEECAEFIQGNQEKGMQEVVFELASQMVSLASRRTLSSEEVKKHCSEVCKEPETFAVFKKMFEYQSGNWDLFVEQSKAERKRLLQYEFKATQDGTLESLEAKSFGLLLIALGGGRLKKEDKIDYHVGFEFIKKCGDSVKKGDTIVKVFHRKDGEKPLIQEKISQAVKIGNSRPVQQDWVVKKVL